jgi:hypothetical protein
MEDNSPPTTSIHFDPALAIFIVTRRGQAVGFYRTEEDAEQGLLTHLKALIVSMKYKDQ